MWPTPTSPLSVAELSAGFPLHLLELFFLLLPLGFLCYGLPFLGAVLLWTVLRKDGWHGIALPVGRASRLNLACAPLAFVLVSTAGHVLGWHRRMLVFSGMAFGGLWAASLVLALVARRCLKGEKHPDDAGSPTDRTGELPRIALYQLVAWGIPLCITLLCAL